MIELNKHFMTQADSAVHDRTHFTDSNALVEVLDGDEFNMNPPPQVREPVIRIPGEGIVSSYDLNLRMLSTHLLILGGIGTGKTNTFYHLISGASKMMGPSDAMIIFDTKGDFLTFQRQGDVVIGNGSNSCGPTGEDYWNIFREIDPERKTESIRELCRSLFKENLENTSNSYFPNAACDLMAALMTICYDALGKDANNRQFLNFINSSTTADFIQILNRDTCYRSVINHISDPNSGQSQGVVAEMNSVINKVFIGNFAKVGTLSLRELVARRQGRRIFIEYDIEAGEVLTPIYNLMFDMAIKKALSERSGGGGSVFFFVDEFKLLPHLSHIDDAVNFGRSLGVKMCIGLQSITQMYDNYGESRSKSILSGFLNNLFFRVNNKESRDYIKEYYGQRVERIRYDMQGGIGYHLITTDVIKDKDITRLEQGEAIVASPDFEPYVFRFSKF